MVRNVITNTCMYYCHHIYIKVNTFENRWGGWVIQKWVFEGFFLMVTKMGANFDKCVFFVGGGGGGYH